MDYFEDNYDYSCPHCEHEFIRQRHCTNFCQDGFHDESDEDFMVEGTILISCPVCYGTGLERWCLKCGKDINPSDLPKTDFEDEN